MEPPPGPVNNRVTQRWEKGCGLVKDLTTHLCMGGCFYLRPALAHEINGNYDENPVFMDARKQMLRLVSNEEFEEMLGAGRLDIAAAVASTPGCPPPCPPAPCDADVNADGVIDVTDLVQIVLDWGPCPGCPTDIDGDGEVAVGDLIAVVVAWGPCEN